MKNEQMRDSTNVGVEKPQEICGEEFKRKNVK